MGCIFLFLASRQIACLLPQKEGDRLPSGRWWKIYSSAGGIEQLIKSQPHLEFWRHTTVRGFQLESVSSVCGRTTYFALGQSRQSRPGASQIFHVTKAGPRTP